LGESSDNEENNDDNVEPFIWNNSPEIACLVEESNDDDDLPIERPPLVSYPAEKPFSVEEYSDDESSEGTLVFVQSPEVYDESPEYGVLDFYNVLGENSENKENNDDNVMPFTFDNLPEISPFEESEGDDDDDLPMDRPALVSRPGEIVFFSAEEDSDIEESSEDHSMVFVEPYTFDNLPEISPFEENEDDDLPMDLPALVNRPGEIVFFSTEEDSDSDESSEEHPMVFVYSPMVYIDSPIHDVLDYEAYGLSSVPAEKFPISTAED